jgi:hypothetical protein
VLALVPVARLADREFLAGHGTQARRSATTSWAIPRLRDGLSTFLISTPKRFRP